MSNPFAKLPPIPAPEVTPPPPMPDPNSPDAVAAKRRAQQDVFGRAGRSSTILSEAMGRTGAGGGPAPAGGVVPGGPAPYGSGNLGAGT